MSHQHTWAVTHIPRNQMETVEGLTEKAAARRDLDLRKGVFAVHVPRAEDGAFRLIMDGLFVEGQPANLSYDNQPKVGGQMVMKARDADMSGMTYYMRASEKLIGVLHDHHKINADQHQALEVALEGRRWASEQAHQTPLQHAIVMDKKSGGERGR